ncbi:RNA polymerase sigma-70 factor (ECF subfamily) [Chitinophaga dinghuensis]|uniref:RNA polymerase sigma-70 factor (ECF subfamily) n=1 Tax=Chitinophaga dinghuensis TaxID=1539050 RepID=A0A327VW03_9BACT|nr:sigma-70 family RNA polymerase sigma factor [Chitinophaga dinghuensis]RAJ80177.1 RNA polymerase sigma-70 factor (ECF subfamily) [Chitinophaga dinghuensis]
MKQLPDTALLERMRVHDDKAAFDELYHRYWEQLYTAAYARLQQDADAKDCVQDVFIALWQKRKDLDIREQLSAYLHVALKYRVFNHFRNSSTYQKHLDVFADIPVSPLLKTDGPLLLNEMQRMIAATVAAMPQRMRDIYLLNRRDFRSIDDIASQLALSRQTVKNQLGLALSRIREQLSSFK